MGWSGRKLGHFHMAKIIRTWKVFSEFLRNFREILFLKLHGSTQKSVGFLLVGEFSKVSYIVASNMADKAERCRRAKTHLFP